LFLKDRGRLRTLRVKIDGTAVTRGKPDAPRKP
jgi:hypothetical protein